MKLTSTSAYACTYLQQISVEGTEKLDFQNQMSSTAMLLLVAALIQSVSSFQSGVVTAHVSRGGAISKFRTSSTVSDAPPVEISDVRRMIDESAASLMKRFWEIDLQTQRRMDMILRLYEVRKSYQIDYILFILVTLSLPDTHVDGTHSNFKPELSSHCCFQVQENIAVEHAYNHKSE